MGPLACDHVEFGKALVLRLDDASERCRELTVQCLLALDQVSQAGPHQWCSSIYNASKQTPQQCMRSALRTRRSWWKSCCPTWRPCLRNGCCLAAGRRLVTFA